MNRALTVLALCLMGCGVDATGWVCSSIQGAYYEDAYYAYATNACPAGFQCDDADGYPAEAGTCQPSGDAADPYVDGGSYYSNDGGVLQ